MAKQSKDRQKIASDGDSTDYYKLPEGAVELADLFDAKGMCFNRANIFKACYRLGEKEGVDIEYDINKIIFFANRLKEAHKKGYEI